MMITWTNMKNHKTLNLAFECDYDESDYGESDYDESEYVFERLKCRAICFACDSCKVNTYSAGYIICKCIKKNCHC